MSRTRRSWIPLGLALLAATAWAVKAVSIAAHDGPGEGAVAAPAYLVGAVAALAAVVSTALLLTSGRSRRTRGLAVAAGLLGVVALVAVVQVGVLAVVPVDGWVRGELNLWVVAAALLVAAVTARRQAG